MPSAMMAIGVILVIIAALVWGLGWGFAASTILVAVGLVAMLKGFSDTKFAQGFPVKSKKQSGYIGVGALIIAALMFTGTIGDWQFQLPGLPGAGVGPSGELPEGVDEDECWAMASDELRGKASSIVQNAYDQQSNTPNSAAVDVNPTQVYKNGDFHTTLTDTSDASLTTAAVGQVLEYYPAGTTYYGDYKSKCVLTQADEVLLDVHTITSDANMDVVCYDDTGVTALSAAGNTTQSDYDITMGADAEETFYCKWKANAANAAFRFGGVINQMFEGTADTIDAVTLIGVDDVDADDGFDAGATPSFSSQVSPKFAKNNMVGYDVDANTTAGYDDYWEASTPLLLEEWESIKIQFEVESGGSDPVADTDNAPTTKTALYLYGIDAQWTRGADGEMHLATHTQDTSEGNVGLNEILDSPVGSTLGVAIELI